MFPDEFTVFIFYLEKGTSAFFAGELPGLIVKIAKVMVKISIPKPTPYLPCLGRCRREWQRKASLHGESTFALKYKWRIRYWDTAYSRLAEL